jgi:hypothetical protein
VKIGARRRVDNQTPAPVKARLPPLNACFGSDTVTAPGLADEFVTAGAVIAALGFAANLLIVALAPTACAECLPRGLDTGDGSFERQRGFWQ